MKKMKQWVEVDIEFDAIRVVAEMRYPEEDCPDGMFGLKDDTLDVTIDLEPVAKIRGWHGPPISLHTKVCDRCSVYLLNAGSVVLARENDYVPAFMPGDHYGDYVILEIDGSGVITNWKSNPRYQESFQKEWE